MRLLLDTHLLLWALGSPSKLPAGARRLIMSSEVFVSAASLWEISIKAGLGKLAADPIEVLGALEPAGFLQLPVTGEHAAGVIRLPPLHRDPFDRLLVAQALAEPMRLLTNDAVLAGYGDIVTVTA
ncbi:MAG: type II toxin-antitoxin system VapC family toxin [Gammaproteobacteria bacterium]|nr:type II toxin-antitoxin system VapC family toxin [Gammaproteobacteria bacterium]